MSGAWAASESGLSSTPFEAMLLEASRECVENMLCNHFLNFLESPKQRSHLRSCF